MQIVNRLVNTLASLNLRQSQLLLKIFQLLIDLLQRLVPVQTVVLDVVGFLSLHNVLDQLLFLPLEEISRVWHRSGLLLRVDPLLVAVRHLRISLDLDVDVVRPGGVAHLVLLLDNSHIGFSARPLL